MFTLNELRKAFNNSDHASMFDDTTDMHVRRAFTMFMFQRNCTGAWDATEFINDTTYRYGARVSRVFSEWMDYTVDYTNTFNV